MKLNNTAKQEPSSFLEKINKDLNGFIKNRIQGGITSDKEWSQLFKKLENRKCWERFSCTKMDCPGHNSENYRCWLLAGTLCGSKTQGVFAEKFGSCLNCEFYKNYHENPIRSLYENISILIAHMSDEASEFHQKAMTDSLTGLLNRSSFDEITEKEVARAKRQGNYLILVMFDLDHFKEINDEYGHVVGDFYLMEFAAILRRVSRETDFVFRTGGDEFIVTLVNTEKKNFSHYINRVQEAIARWNESKKRSFPHLLAASAGGACLNDFGFDIHQCLEKSDQRMYQNKQDRKTEQQLLST